MVSKVRIFNGNNKLIVTNIINPLSKCVKNYRFSAKVKKPVSIIILETGFLFKQLKIQVVFARACRV